MKKLLVVLMFVVFASPAAMAGTLQNNAGCGIGTLIFEKAAKLPDGGWLIQTLASMTNATFSSSFSMTGGILGCEGSVNKVVSTKVYEFVNANIDDIARDVAMGHGATIDSLSAMLKVKDTNAFASTLQANFAKIFPTANVQSAEVANKIVALI